MIKMKKHNRATTFLAALTLVLVFTLCAACALADIASGTCGNDLTWVLDEEYTLTISGSGAMVDCSNTSSPWYSNQKYIKNVVIGSDVTSIGNWAFYYCESLVSVTMPENLTSIGSSAFRGCSALTSIRIPEEVTSIGEYTFYGCKELKTVNIPEKVTTIGQNAFRGCTGLKSVMIGENVTSIGNFAF